MILSMAKKDDSREISHVKSCTFRSLGGQWVKKYAHNASREGQPAAGAGGAREGIKMPVYHVYHPIYVKIWYRNLLPRQWKFPPCQKGINNLPGHFIELNILSNSLLRIEKIIKSWVRDPEITWDSYYQLRVTKVDPDVTGD